MWSKYFNKLDRYIASKFIKTFLVTIFLFVVIIIIFDVAEKLDNFLKRNAPVSEIISVYYVSFIPTLINTFSPIFIFISVLYFTSKMASRSEIISMLAGGMSLLRILRPYMIVGALMAYGSYLLNAWLIPISDKKRVKFENTYLRDYWSESRNAIYRQIKPGVIMYMEYFSNHDSSGIGVTVEEYKGIELKSSLFGRFIRWDKRTKTWRLELVTQREFLANGNQKVTVLPYLDTNIGFNPANFFFRVEDVQSLNQSELSSFISKEKERGSPNVNALNTELYRRYASPFSTFILIAIGVSVAGKKTRGGLGIALGVGIFVILFFLFFSKYFISLGATGVVTPQLAVWLPNLLFVPVAYIFYRFAQK
jgi:lipopolysaccharide export system permease protein